MKTDRLLLVHLGIQMYKCVVYIHTFIICVT